MKSIFVKETRTGLRFPASIPSRRGNKKEIAISIILTICFIVSWCMETACLGIMSLFSYTVTFLCLATLTYGLCEVVIRLCTLCEEYDHLQSRYDNSLKVLLSNVFRFTTKFYVSIILSISIGPFFISKYSLDFFLLGKILLWLFTAMLVQNLLSFDRSPVNTATHIANFGGLDYGSGMAHSFFHGYLQIILPNTGRPHDKGLREFQEDYEARNGITFAAYKLFILIPLSQNCPPRLSSDFSHSVSESVELEGKNLDRAGVTKRNYKNSVYKILSKTGQLHYVAAEYATPIKTLYEVMNTNSPAASLYKQHRKEILYNFYTVLLDLLKRDSSCRDLCDVIYYNDIDENGQYYDVGRIILKRLQFLERTS